MTKGLLEFLLVAGAVLALAVYELASVWKSPRSDDRNMRKKGPMK